MPLKCMITLLGDYSLFTKDRVHSRPEDRILILKDTTEFSYNRDDQEAIGSTRKDLFGKPIQHKKCEILMHSSLAVTANGLPLGLTAIKFWTRKQFKGTDALKKHINPTCACLSSSNVSEGFYFNLAGRD